MIKLYPTTFTGDVEGLQSGLSGTVVTFEQNMKDVAKMMEGQLLPRKPDILPSLITISFIGRGKLPRRWLQNTFRVRRNIVFDALGWYRGHNGYFRKVSISETNLALLPEDNIPRELEALICQTSDPEVAAMEEGGYVPLPEQNGKDVEIVSSGDCEPSAAGSSEADVIPLHYTGFHDTDMNTTTASELQQWGMARLWGDGKEGGYAVRHSTKPASDFPSPFSDMNFSELTFPSLFPYGMGGFEKTRPIEISLKDHIRWALEYHDRRFRLHPHFPFTMFSIVQKREAMSSAKIQMSGPDAERQMRIISSVTPKDLKQSAEEEDAKKPISNAAVRTLRKHVFGAAARVEGSDAACMAHRSKIWSTTMMEGPPTVWITINPADIHNPIAQVFARVDIDLDNFVKETGPDSTARARNVAQDPFAAAKFHHFIINTILETLFGIKVNRFLIQRKTGVFGELNAYLGVDEVQNRGTLHTHMLLWFRHAPSVDETTSLLKSDDFRQKMVEFIKRNVRAYMPGFEDKTSVEKIEKDPNAGYSRPPNPSLPSYEDRLQAHELTIVQAEQVHKCQKGRCLVVKKNGLWGCKRNAPFEKSEDDVVEESGKWRCKRSYEFMNSWNPSVTVNVGCNNDIKPLLNGREVVNILFYNSTYMSKAQKHQFNISAVLAKGMESHLRRVEDEARKELERGQKTLLFRMLNSINREQELSAPLVMSYLMGWGDVHSSHMYTVLRWNTFSSQLRRMFPALKWQKMITKEVTESSTNRNEFTQEEVPNETLTVADNGTVFAKSQFTDYVLRGTNLNHICLLDFIVDTYDEAQKESKRADSGAESSGENQRGRPRNLRSKYDSRHPNALTRERVIRSNDHRNLPNVTGGWFPKRDDDDTKDAFCASMLMLLKPWRNLAVDLKTVTETWESAYSAFISKADAKRKFIIAGTQFLHQAQTAMDNAKKDEAAGGGRP
ncbi:hypothetical protein D9757_004879 [Collybiopsis confluens]|uniref:Helitron helicase-like domain-containing protein n=1 Tax=Collybiopsis confluens TaxID=2823264 RepID=A0A8H5HT38_9AGAR|nr:hypothetical protein D9757_004879 [Collybiopsis confluens]